ncbi:MULTISPECIES: hypothetical protein [unclassified Thiomonas]|uniref:hypothetical protein n=1 Tax=unclassified Thiomonas TaxID=2625466 RepID=UPI0004DBB2C9|nr:MULTISPECIES: hypothetical protein [unclassified Thiomonas]CDW96516.1 conserved hypothetical protein [Thiomonas sp. CB2]SCC95947.1 conserved protein of unknown function [Thiomonas sp. X19]
MAQHKSNSSVQKWAEQLILQTVKDELNLNFSPCEECEEIARLGVCPDGVDVNNKTVIEVYSHVGKLKGAQLHKIKGDILKLVYIDKSLNSEWKKLICFCDNEAANFLLGDSWAARAAKIFGIQIHIAEIDSDAKKKITDAQTKQLMVNA